MKTEYYFKVDDFSNLKKELTIRNKFSHKDIYFDNRRNDDDTSYLIVRIIEDKIIFIYNNIEDDLHTALSSYINTNGDKNIEDVIHYLAACYFECIGVLEYDISEGNYHIIDAFDISLELMLINDVYKFVKLKLSFDQYNERTAELCESSISKKFQLDQEIEFDIQLIKLLLKPFSIGDDDGRNNS